MEKIIIRNKFNKYIRKIVGDLLMPDRKNIETFLGRLEASAIESSGWQALRSRAENYLAPHLKNNTCPGASYLYLGDSSNLEHILLNTRMHHQRRTCIELLLESKGDEHYCVRLDIALSFEGFDGILSRFERDLLRRLPAHTLIGPSYDGSGNRIAGAFTIWRPLKQDREISRILIKA